MRNALLERLGITATAWSADGDHFGFVARLEEAPTRAGYVRLRLPDRTTLLGQIHRRAGAARDAWRCRCAPRLQRGSGTPMTIGVLASRPEVRADLRSRGFNRHTLLCCHNQRP